MGLRWCTFIPGPVTYVVHYNTGRSSNGTIAALKSYLSKVHNAERLLLKALNGLQFMRYYEIVKADKSQEAFIKGWVLNRVE
jgi:hypothetical protein